MEDCTTMTLVLAHIQLEGNDVLGAFGSMAGWSWYNGKFYYVENGTDQLYEVDIVEDVAM